jgi:cell division transport system permease protein
MRDTLTSIRRAPYQSLASFLILFFTLFLALFFFNITSFFNGILGYVSTQPQVTVYFQTETKESDISALKRQLEQTGKVSHVKYVSKDQALRIYKDLNKANPLLLEMVSADILPASLEIYTTKPEYLSEIAKQAGNQPIVDEVVYQRDIVDKLVSLTNGLRKLSLGILGFLVGISFIVLMTTSAFKIALKKDEIQLLRFLGASKMYIRRPFLNEGIFFGWASATMAFLVYYTFFFYGKTFFDSYLNGIGKLSFFGLDSYNLFVWPPTWEYIGLTYVIVVLFGTVIGFFGNFLATSKYIKI